MSTALTTLPAVTAPAANDNFGGSYERDENGIIDAHSEGIEMEDPSDPEEIALDAFFKRVLNEQYTILHDNFGAEHAEKANYGWVEGDDFLCTKIGMINGYSTISTTIDDEEKTIVKHTVSLVDERGETESETIYLAGNAALAA